ncbi:Hypothetical_protein [Hexamita inflata]|uniref:Hypothetical_protein n=1 Tax=Hexamita inflata TaxID=28002 RepID=A0AA86TWX1_9EUKA|nr:Hypothetical protein HINF_LOCUS17762 [Hexamita inflata]
MSSLPISTWTKILEPSDGDCVKLQLFKNCMKYKKFFDEDANQKVLALKKLVYKLPMNATNIFNKILEEGEVFTDDSSALYISESQMQMLRENKLNICFVEFIQNNSMRQNLVGTPHTFRAADLYRINEAKNDLKLVNSPTLAVSNYFQHFVLAVQEGFIKPICGQNTQNEPVLTEIEAVQKELKETQEILTKERANYEAQIRALKDENLMLVEKLNQAGIM